MSQIDGSEVQAIARASRILAALEASPGGLSLAQIAQRVELPRSTVHRIVKALTTERFLVPVSSAGGVRLGPRLAVYATQTVPLLDYYRDRHLLSTVSGEGDVAAVSRAIRNLVGRPA